MECRVISGMVMLVASVVGVGLVGGCHTQKPMDKTYTSELGRKESIGDTPLEVQEFVKDSFPGAEVEAVYEMRHNTQFHMRHFEIHMILEGGRKKTVDYNTFEKKTPGMRQLETTELKGDGGTPAAQQRGDIEATTK